MERRKPFIPAAARHDRIGRLARVQVTKRVRDLVASGITSEVAEKHDGKQGSLDGIPNLVLGGPVGGIRFDDEGGGPPKKDVTEKSTDKGGKEGKDGKESKDSDEKGKDAKDTDEAGKFGASEMEFGFLRYGRPEALQAQQLAATVMAHAARGLAKGPMV